MVDITLQSLLQVSAMEVVEGLVEVTAVTKGKVTGGTTRVETAGLVTAAAATSAIRRSNETKILLVPLSSSQTLTSCIVPRTCTLGKSTIDLVLSLAQSPPPGENGHTSVSTLLQSSSHAAVAQAWEKARIVPPSRTPRV